MELSTRSSNAYGQELVLDLSGCDVSTFNRSSIQDYFTGLCDLIDMEMCDIHFWDDLGVDPSEWQTEPHTQGTSAVCFILTSTIVVHTLDLLERVYLNIFSCKPFDPDSATEFSKAWFHAKRYNRTLLDRV